MEAYLGTWHRVCSAQNLGSFARIADSKSYVVVSQEEGTNPPVFSWRFGANLESLRVGYTTTTSTTVPPTSVSSAGTQFIPLQVSCGLGSGSGTLRTDGVISLTLLQSSGLLATVVYRTLDADTIAVSIVEVHEKGDASTILNGFLFRVPGPSSTSSSQAPY